MKRRRLECRARSKGTNLIGEVAVIKRGACFDLARNLDTDTQDNCSKSMYCQRRPEFRPIFCQALQTCIQAKRFLGFWWA